jgi:hypothetical protein
VALDGRGVIVVHGRGRDAASDEKYRGNGERKAASMRLGLVGCGTDRGCGGGHGKPPWLLDLLSLGAVRPDDSAALPWWVTITVWDPLRRRSPRRDR